MNFLKQRTKKMEVWSSKLKIPEFFLVIIYAAILCISSSFAISLSTASPFSLRFMNLSKSTIL